MASRKNSWNHWKIAVITEARNSSIVSGMQQIRKKNASPAARKKPLSAKKRENAPRMASIKRGSEQAAHQASVHLDGRARHVRGTLGGQEDDDVGELLRRAHAADR